MKSTGMMSLPREENRQGGIEMSSQKGFMIEEESVIIC